MPAALLILGNIMSTNKEPIKGNEAEEFIKRIVLKVLLAVIALVVGVGLALYL
jgi:hypothetical protein